MATEQIKAHKWWDKLPLMDKKQIKVLEDKDIEPKDIERLYIKYYKNASGDGVFPSSMRLLTKNRREVFVDTVMEVVNDFRKFSGGEWIRYSFHKHVIGLSSKNNIIPALIKQKVIEMQQSNGPADRHYRYALNSREEWTKEEANKLYEIVKSIARESQKKSAANTKKRKEAEKKLDEKLGLLSLSKQNKEEVKSKEKEIFRITFAFEFVVDSKEKAQSLLVLYNKICEDKPEYTEFISSRERVKDIP